MEMREPKALRMKDCFLSSNQQLYDYILIDDLLNELNLCFAGDKGADSGEQLSEYAYLYEEEVITTTIRTATSISNNNGESVTA